MATTPEKLFEADELFTIAREHIEEFGKLVEPILLLADPNKKSATPLPGFGLKPSERVAALYVAGNRVKRAVLEVEQACLIATLGQRAGSNECCTRLGNLKRS